MESIYEGFHDLPDDSLAWSALFDLPDFVSAILQLGVKRAWAEIQPMTGCDPSRLIDGLFDKLRSAPSNCGVGSFEVRLDAL